MPNCILYFIFTQKNHRNVAHTQHSHKVAEILNTTHSFMQLLYCIKSPKTRQKNTHNNNKGRRRQTAQQQHWRSVALFLLSLSQCVQKYEQHWHCLFSHTHTHTLFLLLSCKAFVYRLTCVIGICDVPLWYACVCLCYHHCLCTLCEKRALK